MNKIVRALMVMAAIAVGYASSSANASPLVVTVVDSNTIACFFNVSCEFPPQPAGDFEGALPAISGISGLAELVTRRSSGGANAPGAGMRVLMYRANLVNAKATTNAAPCINSLTVDFGPNASFHYNSGGPLADVFDIQSGGVGDIGLKSVERSGSNLTFRFSTPVCAGHSSHYFGLAVASGIMPTTAHVTLTTALSLPVAAQAPTH